MVSSASSILSKEQRRHLLRTMLESRFGDLREESLNRQGKGHFSVSGCGHEAMCAIGAQLREGDFILPYYRDRGLCMGRGMTTKHLALEYFAKRGSASRGRMMPSHFSSRELNIVSVPTPLGAHLLPACGVAWAMKLDGKAHIVVATGGDAATRQGDFYEAISFALERRLPILFLVEDNGYGISTPTRHTNPLAIGVLNAAKWEVIDGSDIELVHATTQAAIAKLRAGKGPVFIWAELERLSSHTSSDDHTLYRSQEDIESMGDRDPVRVLRARMIEDGEITEAEFAMWEEEVKESVRADYSAAERAEDPRAEELFSDVTGDSPDLDEVLFEPGRYRMGDLVNLTLRAGLAANPERMIFGEDVEDPKGGVFRLTQKLSTNFPKQVYNSPLAESTIFGVGGGLALHGRRPVFELQFIDFSFPGFNQLVQNLATVRWRSGGAWTVPAVFYAPYGGYLPGGSIWHSQANESAFAHFPGINIVIPSTPEDAAGLLWTAMHGEDVTLFLLPKHLLWAEVESARPVKSVPLGRARVLAEGGDLTLVAWGNTVEKAREAIAGLDGVAGIELIDLRSIMPWDQATIEASVRKTGRLLVVQEDTETCSVGQMIITHVSGQAELWAAMKAPPRLVSKGHVTIGYNPIYEYAALPSADQIIEAIRTSIASDVARGPVSIPASEAATIVVAGAGTNDFVVRVPIMGEGLRSARVVSFAKNPGDNVACDEVLCELETDKAVYAVEASISGRLREWRVGLDETVLIGQEIAIIASGPAIEKSGGDGSNGSSPPAAAAPPNGSVRQPTLIPSITKRLDAVVAANMLMDVRWEPLKRAREEAKAKFGKGAPSPSAMMAWCVTLAQDRFPAFRCLLDKEGTILEQRVFDQGIAVTLEGDRLATASIAAANTLSFADFVAAYAEAVEGTRAGKVVEVQAPVNITSLGGFGIESATPIVVPPAMATLFIGTAHARLVGEGDHIRPDEVVTLSLTFDHRVVNGAGAAAFLMELKKQIEGFEFPE